MRRLLRSLLVATLAVALTALPGGAQSQPGDGCPSLAGQTVASDDIGLPSAGATITSAQLVAATPQGIGPNGSVIPEKPAYCEVQVDQLSG